MRFTLKHAALAAACMAAMPAYATNGYFLPGFGFRSQGMGGVGIAYGRDSLSIAANPANIVNTGMRGDLGFAVFNPERHARIWNDPATPTVGFFGGDVESDAKYFIMPEMGFTMPLDSQLSAGVAFVGNGGMNTTYRQNFFSFFGTPPADSKVGVDMMQLLVPVTAGYKINENHAVGASLVLAETRFRAYGLEAFQAFPILTNTNLLTGKGFDYSYGAGIRLGWLGEFMDDKLSLGLTYASKTWMTKFDKYGSLFAEQGDFDIPENYGIGIAFKPVKNLTIAADVMRINFSGIASIGNRGPGTNPDGLGPLSGVPALDNSPNNKLGADDGMGFGWKDQTVYKIGVNYGVNSRLQVRGGFNYGKSPIPDDQVTFNLLAPATVEKHYSIGFTYKANDNLELTGTYMYAASHGQSRCDQNIVDCASFNMHQNVFAISAGWVLDPGKTDYGDTPSSAKDYEFGTTNFYAGIGIGQARIDDWSDFVASDLSSLGLTGTTNVDDRSMGVKLYGGYKFNKYFALEGGFVDFNDTKASASITAPGAGTAYYTSENDAWTLAAVGTLPVTKNISLLAKVGGAHWSSNIRAHGTGSGAVAAGVAKNSDVDVFYGVGASYALMDNIDVRGEWERYDFDGTDVDLLTAGLAIRF